MSDQNTNENQTQQAQPQFEILRIYSKDCSLETPNSPALFVNQAAWKPKINVEFDAKPTHVAADQFEVDLRVTVTCNNVITVDGKEEEKVAFICEVHQAGLFLLRNLGQDSAEYLLSATAPNILFPYAREHISSMVTRSTFPPLNLRPLNFEALFRARKMQEAQKAQSEGNSSAQAEA